jgi:hypothetical protein
VAAGNDALAAAVRERQDLTGRWQRLDADIVKAASRAPAERNPTQEQGLHAALQETARQLDALDARIAPPLGYSVSRAVARAGDIAR